MSADDAGLLCTQRAALLTRGQLRTENRELNRLVQRLYDLTGINSGEILEMACEDAAGLLIEGDAT